VRRGGGCRIRLLSIRGRRWGGGRGRVLRFGRWFLDKFGDKGFERWGLVGLVFLIFPFTLHYVVYHRLCNTNTNTCISGLLVLEERAIVGAPSHTWLAQYGYHPLISVSSQIKL